MTIQLDDVVVSTTMRTPGHDFELAAGFCLTEGLLAGARVVGVRYCANDTAAATLFNEVTVETGGLVPTPVPRTRDGVVGCGWCGSDQIEVLVERLTPLPPSAPIPPACWLRRPTVWSTGRVCSRRPGRCTPPRRSTATVRCC